MIKITIEIPNEDYMDEICIKGYREGKPIRVGHANIVENTEYLLEPKDSQDWRIYEKVKE